MNDDTRGQLGVLREADRHGRLLQGRSRRPIATGRRCTSMRRSASSMRHGSRLDRRISMRTRCSTTPRSTSSLTTQRWPGTFGSVSGANTSATTAPAAIPRGGREPVASGAVGIRAAHTALASAARDLTTFGAAEGTSEGTVGRWLRCAPASGALVPRDGVRFGCRRLAWSASPKRG
jgi:hypothetical protein